MTADKLNVDVSSPGEKEGRIVVIDVGLKILHFSIFQKFILPLRDFFSLHKDVLVQGAASSLAPE